MPIYEYECPKCGARFEELVFGNDVPACPKCGAAETHKLLSCACFRTAGASDTAPSMSAPSSGKSSCAGCSGGNCSTCH